MTSEKRSTPSTVDESVGDRWVPPALSSMSLAPAMLKKLSEANSSPAHVSDGYDTSDERTVVDEDEMDSSLPAAQTSEHNPDEHLEGRVEDAAPESEEPATDPLVPQPEVSTRPRFPTCPEVHRPALECSAGSRPVYDTFIDDSSAEMRFSETKVDTKAYPSQYVEQYVKQTLSEPPDSERSESTRPYELPASRIPENRRFSPMTLVAGFLALVAVAGVAGVAALTTSAAISRVHRQEHASGAHPDSVHEGATTWTGASAATPSITDRARMGDTRSMQILESKSPDTRSPEEAIALAQGIAATERALIRELGRRVEQEPGLASQPNIIEKLRLATTVPETAIDTLGVIVKLPGNTAADWLHELWLGDTASSPLAGQLLRLPEVRAKASPAVLIAVDLRVAENCEEFASLMPKAVDHADQRSVEPLQKLLVKRGCGQYKTQDCYPCLRQNLDLYRALSAAFSRKQPAEIGKTKAGQ